jgi:hypothetical protein
MSLIPLQQSIIPFCFKLPEKPMTCVGGLAPFNDEP